MNAADTNKDITALLKARHTLLWIVSREEMRVERALIDAAGAAKYQVRFWDCISGITDAMGKPVDQGYNATQTSDPSAALGWIRNRKKERAIYVLRDLHKWMDPVVMRGVRSLARDLQTAPPDEARALVVLSPSGEIPPELSSATVIDYPLPDRAEVSRILDTVLEALPESSRKAAVPDGMRDQAIDAAVGLSAEEIANCYARSLVTSRTIDPALVSSEKRRVIAREKVLTWHDPDPRGMDAVGGLDLLKGWLNDRRSAFSPEAREFGLPAPKGMLLLGPPGTGKSLVSKCVATAWTMPLLRLDMGSLRSKYVGDSEANIRKALRVAEAVAPCVLWVDEIEKALAGSTGAQGDGGVSADALGTLLSWMQERQGSVFVIATANDVRALPPELLRKGRFDEMFWVDLPNTKERSAIMAASLKQFKRSPETVSLDDCAAATEGFTGAEIAALVPDALFKAFADGKRTLVTDDLVSCAKATQPLSKTASEKLDALREWVKGRARPASTPESEATGTVRSLDL